MFKHLSRTASFFCVILLVSLISGSLAAQTITHVPLYTFNNNGSIGSAGVSVSGIGDVNGDGRADMIVGAPSDNQNGSNSGNVRIISGSDGSILRNFFGETSDLFGLSVSGAGDVNGDGTPDLIAGAPLDWANGRIDSGSARVLSGSDGSELYSFIGNDAYRYLGTSVSGAGDINGDGFDDFVIGVPIRFSRGIARVYSGSDGSVLYSFSGSSSSGEFGRSASGAGDVNGDGTPDLIIGGDFEAQVRSGIDGSILHLFSVDDGFGVSVGGAGDVNGDGKADLIVGAPDADNNGSNSGTVRVFSGGGDGSVIYFVHGDSADDDFGESVSGTGDVNGDGTPDLIVGAPGDDNNGSDSGSARVLSGVDGSVLYNFDGNEGDLFGTSVSGAGDINGDGIDDFLVGATNGGAGFGYMRVFVSQINQPFLLGDCNQDGIVNFSDIPAFISILMAGDYLAEADIDQNDIVNFPDIPAFIAILIGS